MPMSGIRIQNWTYIWQRNIITPVSTILLQENSFKPASSGLFFVLRDIVQITGSASSSPTPAYY
jgi:hypothetical protein